jgi:hypothetical protein
MLSGEWGYNAEFSVVGNTVWFGTNKGRLMKSADRGYHWSAINTPFMGTGGRARMVQFRDTLNGIIADRVSNQLVIYETSNGGITWQAVTQVGTSYANDLCYIPGTPATYMSSGNAAGYSGAAISYDGCHTWSDISGSPGTQYGVLSFPNNITGWAGQVNMSSSVGGMSKYIGPFVDVAEHKPHHRLSVYPNPANAMVTLGLNGNDLISELIITDYQGRMVYYRQELPGNPTINLSVLPEGIYLLMAISGDQRHVQRLVILRN